KLSKAAGPRHHLARFGIGCEERLQRRVVVVCEVRPQVARKRWRLEELHLKADECTYYVPGSGNLSESVGLERPKRGLKTEGTSKKAVRLPPPPPFDSVASLPRSWCPERALNP